MNQKIIDAKSILRLPLGGQHDTAQVEEAFHKMIRRYPLEQFPEKFTEIRQAYQTLIDPTANFRSLLWDDSLDLSSIIEDFAPLNAEPKNETEAFLFKSLSVLLQQNFREILDPNFDLGGYDYEDFSKADLASPFGQDGSDLARLLDEIMGNPFDKPRRK